MPQYGKSRFVSHCSQPSQSIGISKSDRIIIAGIYQMKKQQCMQIDGFSIHEGSYVQKDQSLIIYVNSQPQKSIRKQNKNKKRRQKFFYSQFCCKQVFSGEIKIKGNNVYVNIFEKIGISVYELLDTLKKVTPKILYLLLICFVQLLKKIHFSELNIVNLSFKNLYIAWQNLDEPVLFICNVGNLKRNQFSVQLSNRQILKIYQIQKKQNNIHKKQKRKSSLSIFPNDNSNGRRKSERKSISIPNKAKNLKRADTQNILAKIREIQNDWKVAYRNQRQKQSFDDIIQYISKPSGDIENYEDECYRKWIKQILRVSQKCKISLSEANTTVLGIVKDLVKNDQYLVQEKIKTDSEISSQEEDNSSGFSREEDYSSDISEKIFPLQQLIESHSLQLKSWHRGINQKIER